ncbi:hypothetical protein [Janibacter terrae]|uniref:hypothetical protein n=1 Tax=Janibacter terrae TaxID=103817 RepID=UPI00082B9ED9|nr:hypothetical protein [Janibacter terrae]
MAKTVKFVHVVDAEGHPIDGFTDPVPSHWIDSDLLPEGTKEAPAPEVHEQSTNVDELTARVADLEAENASLRAQLEDQGQVDVPAGNASTEVWAAWAVEHRGAKEEDVKGKSRDELREQYGPQSS